MKWIELRKLPFHESHCLEVSIQDFLSVGIGKYESTEDEEERYTTFASKVEHLPVDMREDDEHDEKEAK
jgi:hypothetical protein